MGDKPFLQIEFDEHYSKVGVITRIEAFLNSISHRPPVQVPDGFNILDVDYHPTFITDRPAPDRTVLLPQAGWATPYLADYFRRQWLAAEEMPAFDRESLTAGRSEMNSKEYLPLPMLVGSAFRALRDRRGADVQFLIPYGYGADADGQYARAVCTVLDRSGHRDTAIAAPILEELPQHAADPDLLLRAVLTGDVLYAALADMRAAGPAGHPDVGGADAARGADIRPPPRWKSSGGRGKPAVHHLAQRGDSGHPRARGLSDRPYAPRRDALGALARQRHRRTGVARALEGAERPVRAVPRPAVRALARRRLGRERLGPPVFVPVLLLISRQQKPPAPALEKALHAGAGG